MFSSYVSPMNSLGMSFSAHVPLNWTLFTTFSDFKSETTAKNKTKTKQKVAINNPVNH